jgi:hypothetical protein
MLNQQPRCVSRLLTDLVAPGPAVFGDDRLQELGVVGINSAALLHRRLRPGLTARNGGPYGLVNLHAPEQLITKNDIAHGRLLAY